MLSISIPTLNSARTLDACLAAIRQQEFPRTELEIVIADAGSTDDTREIARRHGVEKIVENPLLVQMMRGMRRQPDRAWWYHLPVCWITLWVYGLATLGRLLGRKTGALDRKNWQK